MGYKYFLCKSLFLAVCLGFMLGCKSYSDYSFLPLETPVSSLESMMIKLGYDSTNSNKDDKIHPERITSLGFSNVALGSSNSKGDMVIMLDSIGNDTAIIWAYLMEKKSKNSTEEISNEADPENFKNLVAMIRNEYGPPADSSLKDTETVLMGRNIRLRGIRVRWKKTNAYTEVYYGLDSILPGLSVQSHISPWSLLK